MENVTKIIQLSWHEINGAAYVVAYNLYSNKTIPALIEYAAWLSDVQSLASVTVRNEVTYLSSYFEFLETVRRGGQFAPTDASLRDYRDYELAKVVAAPNSRAHERTAKRTVNNKLRRIYSFIFWCQESGLLADNTIGLHKCDVTASLNSELKWRSRSREYRLTDSSYPLLFRRVGESAPLKQRHFATDSELNDIREYFRKSCSEFAYVRNLLLMDVAAETGWRRGSLASLTCEQFESIDSNGQVECAFAVVPRVQKFGYDFSYSVSNALRLRVVSFIETTRSNFLREMGWDKKFVAQIFISARDGQPLTTQALSVIFGRAFRSVGAPAGAGLHSIRRRFVERKVEEELRLRVKLGLDTSAASVAASVAVTLGHTNVASLNSYVNRAQSIILAYSVGNKEHTREETSFED